MAAAVRILESRGQHEEAQALRERWNLSRDGDDEEPPPRLVPTWRRYRLLAGFRRSVSDGLHRLVLTDIFMLWERLGECVPMPDMELIAYAMIENVLADIVTEKREAELRRLRRKQA